MSAKQQQTGTIMPLDFSIKDYQNLRLRPAAVGDEHDIDALYRHSRQDLLTLPLPTAALDSMLAQQRRSEAQGIAHAFPDAQTLVVEHHQRVIARVIFERTDTTLRLIDIIVSPLYQRHGLARHLLSYLQAMACHYRIPLTLRSMKTNHAARQLYIGCDFQVDTEDELSEQMSWLEDRPTPCQSNKPHAI